MAVNLILSDDSAQKNIEGSGITAMSSLLSMKQVCKKTQLMIRNEVSSGLPSKINQKGICKGIIMPERGSAPFIIYRSMTEQKISYLNLTQIQLLF